MRLITCLGVSPSLLATLKTSIISLSETSSLAEMLASALDEEDETAEDGVAAQLQAYLKQMQSGSEEETSLAARIFA